MKYNEKLNPKPVVKVDVSFKDEITERTKVASKKISDTNKRLLFEFIENAKKSSDWKICEETIWPDIQKHILSYADKCENSFTYQVKSKHFETSISDSPCVNEFIHSFICECLVPFILNKQFKAKYSNISGRNNGTHVTIRW